VIVTIKGVAVVRGIVGVVRIIAVIGISLKIDRDIRVVPVKGGGRRRDLDVFVPGRVRSVLIVPRVIASCHSGKDDPEKEKSKNPQTECSYFLHFHDHPPADELFGLKSWS
jgi:hypothetical protein